MYTYFVVFQSCSVWLLCLGWLRWLCQSSAETATTSEVVQLLIQFAAKFPSKAMPNRYVQITENKTVKAYDPNIAGLAEKQDGGPECYGKYCVVTRGESSLTFSNPGMMLGRAEKAGSGVDKILSGWNDLGWATPVLTEELQPDYVVLTLPVGKLKPRKKTP